MSILTKLLGTDPKIEITPIKLKSNKEIIEEIHETFYSEVDKLLELAKVTYSTETQKEVLLAKAEELKKLGFSSTKECQEANKELKRLDDLKLANSQNEHLVGAITYFSNKYPLYRFITEESVKKICAKYNLIYGNVDKYIGTVPTKNLKDIQNFKVDETDLIYYEVTTYTWLSEQDETQVIFQKFIDYRESLNPKVNQHLDDYRIRGMRFRDPYKVIPAKLVIAAPIKDFNTKDMELKDFKLSKIEIPDPVVLQPVSYQNKNYYLIVTAWGDEASDELVVNAKMN